MSSDPYRHLAQLVADLRVHLAEVDRAAAHDEVLAHLGARDILHGASSAILDTAKQLVSLLDWADTSDLPPGLRAALDRPGAHELHVDPANPTGPARGPSPAEAGETLHALVHTRDMGEAYDIATLDVAVLPDDLPTANPRPHPWSGPGPDPAKARIRLHAHAAELDADAGPEELASYYFEPAAARRTAARLRQAIATIDAEPHP